MKLGPGRRRSLVPGLVALGKEEASEVVAVPVLEAVCAVVLLLVVVVVLGQRLVKDEVREAPTAEEDY